MSYIFINLSNLFFRICKGRGMTLSSRRWEDYKIEGYSSPIAPSTTEEFPDPTKLKILVTIEVDMTKLTKELGREVAFKSQETLYHMLKLHKIYES